MIIFSNPFTVRPLENEEIMWGWERIRKFYSKNIQPENKQETVQHETHNIFPGGGGKQGLEILWVEAQDCPLKARKQRTLNSPPQRFSIKNF